MALDQEDDVGSDDAENGKGWDEGDELPAVLSFPGAEVSPELAGAT
jgi:hypothetical protein